MTPASALHHVQLAMPRGEEACARAFYGDVLGDRLEFLCRRCPGP